MSIRKGTTIIAGNSNPIDWTGTLQEYNMALENGIIKQNMVCYITDDTLYTDDIRPEIETLNSVKANKDLSNLSEVGEKHFLNKSQITNCLLEVPQRIKLELADGVLTLKAGSEVIIPNGFEEDGVTPKFDYVTIESDSTDSGVSWNGECYTLYNPKDNLLGVRSLNHVASGTTQPTDGSITIWYDTANNVIKEKLSGVWTENQICLPLGLVMLQTATPYITSIDQVFNGFGYIGQHTWIDKGVKFLMPNGRNEDGTLKSIEKESSSLVIKSHIGMTSYLAFTNGSEIYDYGVSYYFIQDEPPKNWGNNYASWYSPKDNLLRQTSNSGATWDITPNGLMYLGKFVKTADGNITQFNIVNTAFRAVDYSDSSTVSGWGMPTNRFEHFTLGASMSSYTAPANGWFQAVLSTTGNSGLLNFINTSVGNTGPMVIVPANNSSKIMMPVKRGDVVKLEYTSMNTSGFNQLIFIYTEGEI